MVHLSVLAFRDVEYGMGEGMEIGFPSRLEEESTGSSDVLIEALVSSEHEDHRLKRVSCTAGLAREFRHPMCHCMCLLIRKKMYQIEGFPIHSSPMARYAVECPDVGLAEGPQERKLTPV